MSDFLVRKYAVAGKLINVAQLGQGNSALVFIHGWSNNWQGWTLLAHELSPYYQLYLIDLPGFGDSDKLNNYSITTMASYVELFIRQNTLNLRALIAASLGTIIAAKVIEQAPEITPNLILLGAVFKHLNFEKAVRVLKKFLELADKKIEATPKIVETIIKSPLSAYLVEMFLNAYKFDKNLVDKYSLPGRRKITGKAYIEIGLSASHFIVEDFLKFAPNQVLLIYGQADKYVSPKQAQKLLDQLQRKNLTLQIVPQAGHNPAYEQPHLTREIILEFLRARPPR